MSNFKQLFAYETIKVFGVTDRICDRTGPAVQRNNFMNLAMS